jgi:hypothetical protein
MLSTLIKVPGISYYPVRHISFTEMGKRIDDAKLPSATDIGRTIDDIKNKMVFRAKTPHSDHIKKHLASGDLKLDFEGYTKLHIIEYNEIRASKFATIGKISLTGFVGGILTAIMFPYSGTTVFISLCSSVFGFFMMLGSAECGAKCEMVIQNELSAIMKKSRQAGVVENDPLRTLLQEQLKKNLGDEKYYQLTTTDIDEIIDGSAKTMITMSSSKFS